jgi:soluble lytic murein transglycosylase-like protein
MKIGTAYLQDLANKYDGDLNRVVAAYNGGPGANGPSRDCPGSLRWQCQWDNQAQTVPNKGYEITRKYVQRVNNYYSQLSQ